MRIVVAITGATGSIIGVRILAALRDLGVETHLVLSRWGRATLELETELSATDVYALADHVHGQGDHSAAIASGSFRTDGMIIAPCSMKTLAAVRTGYGEGLIPRAADVTMKERRRLVMVPRELPFSEIHLENMLALTKMGVVMAAPVPAFYTKPATIDDIVTHICARVLDQFDLSMPEATRWPDCKTRRSRWQPDARAGDDPAAAKPAGGVGDADKTQERLMGDGVGQGEPARQCSDYHQ